MPIKKKQGKERLDKYYHLAKSQGYRARSAFKLIQLNKKFGFLERARVLVDLCAAPGGWLQVASKYMPVSSLIVGVDLAPIKPIPRVITHQEDITTEKCRTTLRKDLKDWKADVVLHDGAPNVGSAWVQDAYSQSELTLSALKLAVELLGSGGTFVTKVFRSKDYNNLLWVFQQLFRRVEATKPPSSRNVSAEIFVVCSDFLAPKKLDPKFLDPRYVFKELDPAEFASDSTNRFSSKAALNDLLFPERASNKRKREGYEDGATTLRQTDTVASFIRAKESEAMVMLAKCHEIVWDVDEDTVIDDEDDETENLPIDLISIRKHPSTSDEIVECLKDLRVLGRKDFKVLLRWRKAIRKDILESKASNAPSIPDVEMEEAVDEEGKMLEELDALTEQLTKEERRAKKKRQVKIAKEQRRLQLNMIAPKEIGIEGAQEADVFVDDIATEIEAESDGKLFQLRGIAKPSLDQIDQADIDDHDLPSECEYTDFSSEGEEDTDDEDHHLGCLAQEMDEDYEQYIQNLEGKDPKIRIKKARAAEDPFNGADEFLNKSDDDADSDAGKLPQGNHRRSDDDSDDSMSDDFESDAENEAEESANKDVELSSTAKLWFSQPIFADLPLVHVEEKKGVDVPVISGDAPYEDFEEESLVADLEKFEASDSDQEFIEKEKEAQRNIDALSSAEAITMAMRMVQDGRRQQRNILDEYGYNRDIFHDDPDSLPKWFLEDEVQHRRRQLPVTKEAAQLLRERQKELNARPIKKVLEAKSRKKYKAMKKLEKVREKMNSLVADGSPENGDDPELGTKLGQAQSMLQRAKQKAKQMMRRKVEVVVARGGNRGNPGRPKGVKGRYKMVDNRMKKEVRAEKRRTQTQRRR